MAPRAGPTRDHLEAFVFMRTSALQRRRFVTEQEDSVYGDDARVSLLRREEEGGTGTGTGTAPDWVSRVEGLNYQVSRAETRVDELSRLHSNHLSRPPIQDQHHAKAEANIQRVTQDTTNLFSSTQHQLASLQAHARRTQGSERRTIDNIVKALVQRLQQVTDRFRASQGNYLRRLEQREHSLNSRYFATFQGEPDHQEEEDDGLIIGDLGAHAHQDVMHMEEQSRVLRGREQEITAIVASIHDLNTIFKDLAAMVQDQGEVLDRIDVNIENANIKVDQGLQQLKAASKAQGTNRKMKCILCLGPSLIVMLIILILVKS